MYHLYTFSRLCAPVGWLQLPSVHHDNIEYPELPKRSISQANSQAGDLKEPLIYQS